MPLILFFLENLSMILFLSSSNESSCENSGSIFFFKLISLILLSNAFVEI